MKEIKDIAKALSSGDVEKAFEIRNSMTNLSKESEFEINGIVRQAIISFLKKGDVKNVKKVERLFMVPKDSSDDTVKQAVLSSFRDGDMKTIASLKTDLPIESSMAKDLIAYCSTWGKAEYEDCMKSVFA